MLEQKGHFIMHSLAADELVVVQHQYDLPSTGIQVIDQANQDHFRRCLARRRHELSSFASDHMISFLQGGDQITQEALLLIVILI
jgi:hypothetical protein